MNMSAVAATGMRSVGVFLLLFAVLIPIGCSEKPAPEDPVATEARKKALTEENQTKGSGKGKNATDYKNIKGRLQAK